MKKLTAVSLCLAMLLMMAACGSPNQNDTPPSSGEDISSVDGVLTPGDNEENDTPDGDGDEDGSSLPSEEDNKTEGSGSTAADNGTSKPEAKPNPTTTPTESKPNPSKPTTPKPNETKPEAPSTPAKTYSGTLPELVSAIYDKQPLEISVADPIAVDLTDSYSAQYFLDRKSVV